MQSFPLLSLLLILPALTAVAVGLAPARLARIVALVGALLTFGASWPLYWVASTAPEATGYHFVENASWLSSLYVRYHVGVDGASALLILLTTLLSAAAVWFSWDEVRDRVREYFIALLVLEAALIGAFASLDLILFYVFFELSLIPVYFLIGIWGGRNRIRAAMKFFVYTVIGSLLMLAAIIALFLKSSAAGAPSFDLTTIAQSLHGTAVAPLTPTAEMLLFAGFAIAFAIKTPLFPFHTWQADAYAESPTAATVMLAGAMAKLGTYGFYRFCFTLFPGASQAAAPLMVALAVIGIVYGAWIAAVQKDVKRVLAYSSLSHLGFVTLGLFSYQDGQHVPQAMQGALLQMINHGISTGALFLLVGMIEARRGTRRIAQLGGLWEQMPVFGRLFLIVALSSIALPLTNGFVGEFLILLGAFQAHPWAAALATTGVIWSAVYMLWMFQRVMYGPAEGATRRLRDVSAGEFALLAPFVILIFVFGLFPTLFTPGLNLNPGAGSAATTASAAAAAPPAAVAAPQVAGR